MKLSEWLDLPNADGTPKNRGAFALSIGVTPQMISAYCKDKKPNARRMALIHEMTDGAVTPNDWFEIERSAV